MHQNAVDSNAELGTSAMAAQSSRRSGFLGSCKQLAASPAWQVATVPAEWNLSTSLPCLFVRQVVKSADVILIAIKPPLPA